jgi:NTE family protein
LNIRKKRSIGNLVFLFRFRYGNIMDSVREIGLVFAGGGAKGAYQIGVWQALRMFGMETYITATSGTSIGAMNGCMYGYGNLEKAVEMWRHVSKEDILYVDKDEVRNIRERIRRGLPTLKGGRAGDIPYLPPAKNRISLFSRERLERMIRSVLTDPVLQQSPVKCYATCYGGKTQTARSFLLNNLPKENATRVLTATSAIPLVFSPVELGGEPCFDGGLGDNVPVRPLYELGYRNFIIVYLAQRDYVDKTAFPGSHFVEIIPSVSLGDFFSGTLNFNQEAIDGHKEQGFQDAVAIFSKYHNVGELFLGERGKEPLDTELKLKKYTKLLFGEAIKGIVKH